MLRILVPLLAAAAIAACADQSNPTETPQTAATNNPAGDSTGAHQPPGPVASITISPTPSVAVGDSIPLFADARDAAGRQVPTAQIQWTVGDPTVARVEGDFGPSLILRALRSGSTTVTARSGGVSGSATVVVR
jgi:hypothetical protein